MKLGDAIDGQLRIKLRARARGQIEAAVGNADVEVVGASADGRVVAAVSGDDRLIAVWEKAQGTECRISELHSVSVLPGNDERVLLAPLRRDQPFDAIGLTSDSAERIATHLRARLGERLPRGSEWWDQPDATVAALVYPAGLLVKPQSSVLTEKNWYTVAFVNTGVQIRSTKLTNDPRYPGDLREFVPWTRIRGLAVEGANQVERRPSVGAVVLFGVFGLAASKQIRRSYLVVSGDTGDYVFERQGVLPAELAGQLSPILRHFSPTDAQPDPAPASLDDPIEKIRRLSQLRDEGILTNEEFEAKKADLLRGS